jgi:hypothetical protein
VGACLADCETFDDSVAYSTPIETGNSLACRLNQVMRANCSEIAGASSVCN